MKINLVQREPGKQVFQFSNGINGNHGYIQFKKLMTNDGFFWWKFKYSKGFSNVFRSNHLRYPTLRKAKAEAKKWLSDDN